MNARMTEANGDTQQRPLFAARVHADRHRCAGAESGQQQVVRRRAGICAADRHRFIASQLMRTRHDLLDKAVGSAAHRYSPFDGSRGGHQKRLGAEPGSRS
ncbi:hypothetical protein D3C83_07630 [compost metagenome]